jgi:hypothetical protein
MMLEMERQRREVETMVVQIQVVIVYSPQDIAARCAARDALRAMRCGKQAQMSGTMR